MWALGSAGRVSCLLGIKNLINFAPAIMPLQARWRNCWVSPSIISKLC